MKTIYTLLLILFITSVSNAQWNLLDPSPQNNTLYSVYFADNVNGWAVGQSGTIIKTSDSGANWISQTSGVTSNLNSAHFVNSNTGWIAGVFGRILQTSNSGINWNLYQHHRYLSLHSVFFTSENTGWVTCEGGILLKTTNGGIEWLEQQVDPYRVLRSVYFIDSDKGWISGDGGLILKTINGGADWTTQTSGTTSHLGKIFFMDENNGWVNVSTKILRTTDGGTSWTEYSYGGSHSMQSIYFTDVNTGYAGGSSGTILRTSDGGISWIEQTSGLSGNGFQGHLYSVFFIDAVEGWGVGDSGQMLKTTNGGGAGGGEPEQRVVIDEKFDGAQFPPNGWVVNQTHQTNTWMAGNITDQNFSSIDPTNVNSAICPWIAADQDEWLVTPSFALASGAANIEFYSGYSTAWLSAATLKLNISTNGGANWTQIWEAVNDGQPWGWRYQNVDITQYANNANMKLAWQYVGNDGDAAAIDNVKLTGFVTVTDVKEEENERIPNNYELSQNYPNPFNPSTKINYSIPASSKVSLIVYDILGREIKTLVNEFQNAGRYSVDFNAVGLASGIYFYRLKSGQFSETRKLILLR